MSKYTDDEQYQVLTETGRLLKDVAPVEGEEYSLDSILAEFGQGGAKPAPKREELPAEPPERKSDPPAGMERPAPVPQPEEQEEEPSVPVRTDPSLMDTMSLRRMVAANMHRDGGGTPRPEDKPEESRNDPEVERKNPEPTEKKPETPEPAEMPPEASREETGRPAEEKKAPSRLIRKRPVLELIRGGLGRKSAPAEEIPAEEPEELSPEELHDTKEFPVEELGDTKEIVLKKRSAERPAEQEKKTEDAPPPAAEEPAEERGEEPEPSRPDTSVFPDEPEGMHKVPLEQVMSQTVEAVLDEDDAILEKPVPLTQRVGEALTDWRERLTALLTRPEKDGTSPWEQPENVPETVEEEPEPDMEQAAKEAKRLCKKLHLQVMMSALPAVLLLALTALDVLGALDGLWAQLPLLRYALPGILLLITALLAIPMWREMWEKLRAGRPGCELAAGFTALVVLADCAYGALGHAGGASPFAASAAVLVWLCQLGLLLSAEARREAFHLADIGGTPPYGVSVTAAGACKQKGTIDGFYRNAHRADPARKWQLILVPLYLAMATVLAGVVILSRRVAADPLWIWSALLAAAVPLALPLTGTLPLKYLNHRLVKSGSAVAGYHGARAVSRSRRMVVTDDDLFPPGTVGLNGLKVYGEEIGKVVSYAASITQACHSQLHPLFEQLLAAEGGVHLPVEDLHYFEEGGVGGTIRGESVTMGSAYFMRKTHVPLPHELKLKTGVFLAVDGTLIAIFAIKYAPSRNVEWALRALRRNRIEPVLAVRSCNVTPGLLKRRFSLDAKPVYPDVSTRLALSDLSRETAEKSNAIIYREGLMPFAETAVGSRRMVRSVRGATVLAWLGGLCGLLLAYYFTGVGAVELLDPLRMLIFQALWLLPTLLLSGLVKHY